MRKAIADLAMAPAESVTTTTTPSEDGATPLGASSPWDASWWDSTLGAPVLGPGVRASVVPAERAAAGLDRALRRVLGDQRAQLHDLQVAAAGQLRVELGAIREKVRPDHVIGIKRIDRQNLLQVIFGMILHRPDLRLAERNDCRLNLAVRVGCQQS
jgi:hypothetical protein